MPARCFQCKTPVQGWGTGRAHAELTGHVWQPGYYCPLCEATFSSHKLCKAHQKGCRAAAVAHVPHAAGAAPSEQASAVPQTLHERKTSISKIVSCPTCGEHFRDVETLSKHLQDHTTATSSNSLSKTQGTPIKFACTTCKLEFTSYLTLSQHLASVSACRTCKICIPHGMMSLQDHYRVSTMHPMPCPWCNLGFDNFHELSPHYKICMPGVFEVGNGADDGGDGVTSTGATRAVGDNTPSSSSSITKADVAPQPFPLTGAGIVGSIIRTPTAVSSAGKAPLTVDPAAYVVPEDPKEDSRTGEILSSPLSLAPQTPWASVDPEPSTAAQDNVRSTVGVPVPHFDALEYDGFTDDADRSSVIAKAALDLISQRFGGSAAERVLRAMQELGGTIAEERSEREGNTSVLHTTGRELEVPTTPKDGATDNCDSPSSAVRRYVASQSAALAAEDIEDKPPEAVRPPATRKRAQVVTPVQKPHRPQTRPAATTSKPSKPPPARSQSWHCRSCMQDLCVDPIATVCGHIFCRDCLMRELQTHGSCPVCQKMFLLRLDVGVPHAS